MEDISRESEREKPLSRKLRSITSRREGSASPELRGLPAYGVDAGGSAKGATLSVPRRAVSADPDTTLAVATSGLLGSPVFAGTSTHG